MKSLLEKAALTFTLLLMAVSLTGCSLLPGSSDVSSGGRGTRGILKSTDGGKTWERQTKIEGSETGLDGLKMGALGMALDNHQVLYLGTLGGGVYKTQNGGVAWVKLSDGNKFLQEKASVFDVAVESASVVYVATLNENRGVLFKSDDGGQKWQAVYISSEAEKPINKVKIDPRNKFTVYVGTGQGGLLRSDDAGQNWRSLGWFEEGVKDFTVDYNNPDRVLVITKDGVYRTVDGGRGGAGSWKNINPAVRLASAETSWEFSRMNSLTSDPVDPNVVYITLANLVIVTRDGGNTWALLPTITPALTALKTIPQIKSLGLVGKTIYYGAGNALYRSDNQGATWSSTNIPISGDVRYTVSDPTNAQVIYVAG